MEIGSSLAVVLSIVSVCISVASFTLQRRKPLLTLYLQFKQRMDDMLQKHPHLLALHGIDEKRMADLGLLPEEVIYILCSFDMALGAHLIQQEVDPDGKGEILDQTLLEHPKVPVVWNEFAKRRFTDNQKFVDLVETALKNRGVESPAQLA